ncbi:MAG: T6SS protein Cts2N [Kluyvera sp.]|uniref:T6SS protein Cts2N n=1 Tax=Kluyvera sp. TaxID=1538228 RepID=UPI003F2A837B
MKEISFIIRTLLLGITLLMNNGCSFWQSRVDIHSVVIDVAKDANDNAPVAVDIVAIRDAALITQIQSLSAEQWFQAKAQMVRDAPDALGIWSLELVPGAHFVTDKNPLQGQTAEAIVLFARYRSDGDHRLRLDNITSLHLLLMTDDLALASEQGR